MSNITITSTIVLDENHRFSLEDLARLCQIQHEFIIDLVEHDILHPEGKVPADWQFTIIDFNRSRKALHIQRDLEVNLSGIGLILDLLDEIDELQQELKLLKK